MHGSGPTQMLTGWISYEVAWKESIPGCMLNREYVRVITDRVAVELTDSVEFKSLPSGLHHAKEDLMCAQHLTAATTG